MSGGVYNFNTYNTLYSKACDLGLLAYLCSSNCQSKTNKFIFRKAMWKADYEYMHSKLEAAQSDDND